MSEKCSLFSTLVPIFEIFCLALIQFISRNMNSFYTQFGKFISVGIKSNQFFAHKNTYVSRKSLKFMFTEAELMLKVYIL